MIRKPLLMIVKNNNFENTREHLANERTFLAWIRTSIALMGFGFVIVKFSLFLEQLSLTFEAKYNPSAEYGEIVGIIMLVMGLLFALLAFIQYKNNLQELRQRSLYDALNQSKAFDDLKIIQVHRDLIQVGRDEQNLFLWTFTIFKPYRNFPAIFLFGIFPF